MLYSWLLIVHLLAAIAFIGTLFFEVFIWHRAREELAWSAQFTSEQAIARRSRQVLHGVVLLLYGAGIGLAWHYRGVLGAPWASHFSAASICKVQRLSCSRALASKVPACSASRVIAPQGRPSTNRLTPMQSCTGSGSPT